MNFKMNNIFNNQLRQRANQSDRGNLFLAFKSSSSNLSYDLSYNLTKSIQKPSKSTDSQTSFKFENLYIPQVRNSSDLKKSLNYKISNFNKLLNYQTIAYQIPNQSNFIMTNYFQSSQSLTSETKQLMHFRYLTTLARTSNSLSSLRSSAFSYPSTTKLSRNQEHRSSSSSSCCSQGRSCCPSTTCSKADSSNSDKQKCLNDSSFGILSQNGAQRE